MHHFDFDVWYLKYVFIKGLFGKNRLREKIDTIQYSLSFFEKACEPVCWYQFFNLFFIWIGLKQKIRNRWRLDDVSDFFLILKQLRFLRKWEKLTLSLNKTQFFFNFLANKQATKCSPLSYVTHWWSPSSHDTWLVLSTQSLEKEVSFPNFLMKA